MRSNVCAGASATASAKNGKRSVDRIRKVSMSITTNVAIMRGARRRARVDDYLRSQRKWLVDHARWYRAGQRVGSSITECTANFSVNRRMSGSQQMRWPRRGANLLKQERCSVAKPLMQKFDKIVVNAEIFA
jgi:hypothetical protein